ncbi:hypothetical protein ABBQ38_012747 [Trebouxia sp. C0009 RCD-2024]
MLDSQVDEQQKMAAALAAAQAALQAAFTSSSRITGCIYSSQCPGREAIAAV